MLKSSFVVSGGQKVDTYTSSETVSMGDPNKYSAQGGVLTFRGGPLRQNAAYGTVEVTEEQLSVVRGMRTSRLDNTYTGFGFGSQPLIVKWYKNIREMMNITDESKNTTAMKEVIVPSDDGKIYFYDLDTKAYSRPAIEIGLPVGVTDTSGVIGMLDPSILGRSIPVAALCGDQHSALFGQGCFEPGMMKNTYGTGCFLLMNTGDQPAVSQNGLVSTIAWRLNGTCTYALEGSVFVAGAAIQWLRDEMKIIERASETETIARSLPDNGGVYMVPTFTGLGAPYWDMYSRGTIIGLTRGTGRAHVVRAALESIAYQSADLVSAMASDCGRKPSELRVDGGASANQFLMQFQADVLGCKVIRPAVIETTALGAALLAGLAVGVWKDMDEIRRVWQMDLSLTPQMTEQEREKTMTLWHRAVKRSMRWAAEEE